MNSQMTEENAIGLFNEVYSMPEKIGTALNLTELMEEMEGLKNSRLSRPKKSRLHADGIPHDGA